jgi:aspartate aminotransferase-like enzyme
VSTQFPNVDPEGLLEFSVVFTDRSLNHMSKAFQKVMNDISSSLRQVYNADSVAVVPGGGTFGMEAVARQFASKKKCLVIRNGWFSYRWSQIFEMGDIPAAETVLKARPVDETAQSAWAPAPIEQVVATIREEQPDVVFAPHVETSAGIILPNNYLKEIGNAVREVGGLFVLDCIASGAVWVDMKAVGVDVLISAPQKGWSSSPCAALVMLSDRALEVLETTRSTSFAADLKKWLDIMRAYENGGHAYHATMPTDGLYRFRNTMFETIAQGLDKVREQQWDLGARVRALMKENGFKSVAAEGFEAPGVVVCHTEDDALHTGKHFVSQGVQTAAGVPLMCDEPEGFKTFRVGLFGLDKWNGIENAIKQLSGALRS